MRRVRELDAVRGLAAVAVVIFHLWFLGTVKGVGMFAALQFAVDMFFILSGFLITTIILGHGHQRGFLKNFYARRSLRIWPIYYLTLMTVAAVSTFLSPRPSMEWLPSYLIYMQNFQKYWFAPAPRPEYIAHFWTLAIEEQFYLLWPASLLLLGKKCLIHLCLALLAMSIAARSAGYSEKILIARCDGFALGALLAYLSHGGFMQVRPRLWRFIWMLAIAAGLAALGATWSIRPLHLSFINFIFAAILGLILCSLDLPLVAPLRDRRLAYLGVISYGLYLYHPLVFSTVDALGRHWLLEIVKIVVVLCVAALSWTWIERPVLQLKDRFEYNAESDSRVLLRLIASNHPLGSTANSKDDSRENC